MINNVNPIIPYIYSSSEDEQNDGNLALEGEGITRESLVETFDREIQSPIEISNERIDELVSQALPFKTMDFQQGFEFQKQLSLVQAETIIQKAVDGKIVKFLSPVNIFFIEVMKIMQQLQNDRKILSFSGLIMINEGKKLVKEYIQGSQLLTNLSVKLHFLFKAFRDYSSLFEGKIVGQTNKYNIIEAQRIFNEAFNLFVQLEGIVKDERTSLEACHQLKQYLNVLYYLCDETILKNYTEPTSTIENLEHSVMCYPPNLENMNLYLDSLDVCDYSLRQYELVIENDYKKLLKQSIVQIKKIPQNCSEALELNNFIKSLEALAIALDSQLLSSIIQVINISKKNTCNAPLKACFQSLREGDTNFLLTLKEMFPFIQAISNPWDLYKNNLTQLIDKTNQEIKTAFSNFNDSIDTLEKAVAKKKIKPKTRTELNKLISALKKISEHRTFTQTYNALVESSARVPMCTFQEMGAFFNIIESYNARAFSFQTSLIPKISKLPCSPFTALDLWILQIYQCFDLSGSFSIQTKNTIDKLISELLHSIYILQIESIHVSLVDREGLRANLFTILSSIIESLNQGFEESLSEDMLKESSSLKITTHLLEKYLEGLSNLPIFRKHLASTLFHPYSTVNQISEQDLLWIQRCMHRLLCIGNERKMDQLIDSLEEEAKKNLALGIPEAKLDLEYATLAKLRIKEIQLTFYNCYQTLLKCQSPDDYIFALHEYKRKMKPIEKSYDVWASHLTSIGIRALKEQDDRLCELIKSISKWNSFVGYFMQTIDEMISLNPEPKKQLSTKCSINSIFDVVDIQSSESEESKKTTEIISSTGQLETYTQSPYEKTLSHMRSLLDQGLPLLNPLEPIESYLFRSTRRDELIQNSYIYFALIEENRDSYAFNNSAQDSLKKRQQIDHMLFLEATQKTALLSSRIGVQDSPNIHIFSYNTQNNSLSYTHNGEELTNIIAKANKTWFVNKGIANAIKSQESLLKKAYWFKEEIQLIDGIDKIAPCCKSIWEDLASLKSTKQTCYSAKVKEFQNCRSHIHKLKRTQTGGLTFEPSSARDAEPLISKIIMLKENLQFDPQCKGLVEEHTKAIDRVIDLYQSLSKYNIKEKRPLFFAMRSAEIQVSLLSSALILAISTIKVSTGQLHPFFLDYEGNTQGRELFNCHRVDRLWKVLKEYKAIKILDDHISLFVGDPRYPIPNISPLTDDLVKTYERVCLLKKLALGGWFMKEDQKLLNRHLGKSGRLLSNHAQKDILEKNILKEIQVQKEKTLFALELAGDILSFKEQEG